MKVKEIYDKFISKIDEWLEQADKDQQQPQAHTSKQQPSRNLLEDVDADKFQIDRILASEFQPNFGNQLQTADENPEQSNRIRRQRAVMRALMKVIITIDLCADHSQVYIKNKIKTMGEYWTNIKDQHQEIMSHPDIYDYDPDYYSEMEETYQKVKISLEEQLKPTNEINTSTNVKLPKITLPTFDGSYTKWKQFQELFTQLIHNQPIGAAQKMFYLKANLTGEPSRLIKHLQATDDHYCIAWKILLDRYDNQRSLLTALLGELLTQPSLNTENSFGLKRLHDTTKECLPAIGNLNIEVSNWDPIMLHLLLQKLDKESRKLYEQSLKNPREVQNMEHFFKFMSTRFHQLETVSVKDERKKTSTFIAAAEESRCYFCKTAKHKIFNCQSFLKLSPTNRLQAVKRLQLCINCLCSNHTLPECRSTSCVKCNLRHNTLLHGLHQEKGELKGILKKVKQSKNSKGELEGLGNYQHTSAARNQSSTIPSTSLNATTGSHVMLATAVIQVLNASGHPVLCRVLLDSGSQLHFITERMANELGLKRERISIPIGTIGGLETTAKHKAFATIKSRMNDFTARIEVVVLRKISDLQPTKYVQTTNWTLPSHVKFADPAFFNPQAVDMLLGAEIYHQLLTEGQIKFHSNLPILQNTQLGWIVAGRVAGIAPDNYHCYIASQPSISALEQQVQRFWEIEQHEGQSRLLTKEESHCEEHFQKTCIRSPSGQCVVRLPFIRDPAGLGSSFETAKKHLLASERKLERNPQLDDTYKHFLKEYETLNHMQQISREQIAISHYFLPHHGVIKPDSSTTKLRVVFDGSAKTTTGLSLNDLLGVGPTVQPDLFSTVTRFRLHQYVLTADISKMYRQIKVDDKDQQYQLIIRRDNKGAPFQYFKLNTVTYGTASAPYLATRCIKQLAIEEAKSFPLAAEVLQQDIYVDDILTGRNTLTEVKELKDQLIALLKTAHFELRKFCSNHPDILDNIPEEHREKMLVINKSEAIKTLGLLWQPKEDVFQCYANIEERHTFTKRTALSEIARLFDPLGLIAPVVVLGKLFVQELWKADLTWDEEMPPPLRNKWMRFRQQLTDTNMIKIARAVLIANAVEIQLHAFSDSSMLAYGTCCYLRSIDKFGQIFVRLLCAKSRIAPMKSVTIARLELCGALLMSELVDRLLPSLSIKISKVFYYTDSTTTLSWISGPSYTWTTFVAHRVAKIQTLTTPEQWKFIEGTKNPADLVSRGLTPQCIAQSTLWFNGPSFLQDPENRWPSGAFRISTEVPETRTTKMVLMTTKPADSDIISYVNHKNSLCKLERIIGYSLRFINNCKLPKALRTTGKLTIPELDAAMNGIVRNVQRTTFSTEYLLSKQAKPLQSSSTIVSSIPFPFRPYAHACSS